MRLRAVAAVAKLVVILLTLGGLAMAFIADELGPWIFGVVPFIVVAATVAVWASRAMRLRAAMRAVDEELATDAARGRTDEAG